ncbi:hypothetical protein NX059_002951 [Plenodomus lindquistii]|nr:hypothetical protein NX059_002951 [Plenodomus lindquistii]
MLYSGGAKDQVEAFKDKNPSYNWYDSVFSAPEGSEPDGPLETHPWYLYFDEAKDLDDGEASSRALAESATGDVLVFGAIEYQGPGAESFFTLYEVGILKDRLANKQIKSITHMVKGATSYGPSTIMALDDGNGNFQWKNGYKKGDKNASGAYGDCSKTTKRAVASCDKPQPNDKIRPSRFGTTMPAKGMSLSIAMVTTISSGGMSASSNNEWKFYTTPTGKAVGSCGETVGKKLTTDSTDKPTGGSKADPKNPPWPTGIFELDIEGQLCEYRCDGTNAGRLFCPQREIACAADSMKSKAEGMLKCGSNGFFHAVVYCDF